MSTGLYSHTTRAVGTTLTANIYNADHVNHITNLNPSMTGAFSDNVAQMQSTADPYPGGVESLAASLAGEVERLRYAIQQLHGQAQWYKYPAPSRGVILPTVSGTPVQHGGYRESFAKAWGSIGITGAVVAGFNISSVTRTTSGRYTIFWQRAFATGKYVVVGTSDQDRILTVWATGMLATSCKVRIQSGGLYNNNAFHIVAYGRQ